MGNLILGCLLVYLVCIVGCAVGYIVGDMLYRKRGK